MAFLNRKSQQYPEGVATPEGWQIATASGTLPTTSNLTAATTTAGQFAMFMKDKKLVFAYNNAGTITYISIPMDGSTTSWTHSSTPP